MSKKLTAKQQAFVEAYTGLAWGNKTEAAAQAGYKGNRQTLGQVGYENLRKPEIQKAIEERTAQVAMGQKEILFRLGEMARGDIRDFVRVDEWEEEIEPPEGSDAPSVQVTRRRWRWDLERAHEDRRTHLIQSIKEDKDGRLTLKLYSAKDALELLGKYHKMWVEKHEVDVPGLTADDIAAALEGYGGD